MFSNETVKYKFIVLLAFWMRLYFKHWQLKKYRKSMFSRKVSIDCEIHIRPLMVNICGTLQGHNSSRHRHKTADLKTESSSVLSIVLTSAEIGDTGTVMPVLAGSTFSQVFCFLHWVCCVAVSQSILLLCDLSLKGSCLYSQFLFLFYFSLKLVYGELCLLSSLTFLTLEHCLVYISFPLRLNLNVYCKTETEGNLVFLLPLPFVIFAADVEEALK